MFFGTLVSHSPLHMCAHTHINTHVCVHTSVISWVGKYCCKEHPKRGLWKETMEGLMFHRRHGSFWLWEKSYWLGIRKSEILGRLFHSAAVCYKAKHHFSAPSFLIHIWGKLERADGRASQAIGTDSTKALREGHVQYNQEPRGKQKREWVSQLVWTLALFIANWRTASWNRDAPPSDSGFARTVWLLHCEETRHGHGSVGSAGEIMVQSRWNLMVARTREL